jgi:hypothetical protein
MWAKKKLKVEGYKFCCNQKIKYNEDEIIITKKLQKHKSKKSQRKWGLHIISSKHMKTMHKNMKHQHINVKTNVLNDNNTNIKTKKESWKLQTMSQRKNYNDDIKKKDIKMKF